MNEGWFNSGYTQVNIINCYYIGFRAGMYLNGEIDYIGLVINGVWFGWFESYIGDGNIDEFHTGFYLNGVKI